MTMTMTMTNLTMTMTTMAGMVMFVMMRMRMRMMMMMMRMRRRRRRRRRRAITSIIRCVLVEATIRGTTPCTGSSFYPPGCQTPSPLLRLRNHGPGDACSCVPLPHQQRSTSPCPLVPRSQLALARPSCPLRDRCVSASASTASAALVMQLPVLGSLLWTKATGR